MRKPDKQTSRLNALINDIVSTWKSYDQLEHLKTRGRPIFTKEDIDEAQNTPAKLLRLFFVENRITEEYFSECYKHYATTFLAKHPDDANSDKNNKLNALRKPTITDRLYCEILMAMGGTTVKVTSTIECSDGTVKVYEISRDGTSVRVEEKKEKPE